MTDPKVGDSIGSYVRFYNVTGNQDTISQPMNIFDFMPCKSKLLLQRGPSSDDYLPDLNDSNEGDADVRDIYISGQKDYQKLFESKVVSRSHAMVRWLPTQQAPFLIDQGSTHGTYLTRLGKGFPLDSAHAYTKSAMEGEKLEVGVPVPLQDGDVIHLGKSISRGDSYYNPLILFVEISCSPPLRFKDETFEISESEAGESDEDEVIEVSSSKKINPMEISKFVEEARSILNPTEINILSDDESDCDFAGPIFEEEDNDYEEHEEGLQNKEVEIIHASAGVDDPDWLNSEARYYDEDILNEEEWNAHQDSEAEEVEDQEEYGEGEVGQEQEDSDSQVEQVTAAGDLRQEEGIDVGKHDEIILTADAIVEELAAVKESAKEVERMAEDSIIMDENELVGEVRVTEDAIPANNDFEAKEVQITPTMHIEQDSPAVATTVLMEMEVATPEANSINEDESMPSSLAGTKRRREEDQVTSIGTNYITIQEGSGITSEITSQRGIVPRAYKKMKVAGAAFGVGMATGLVAGMVGTFVGLSSFALNEGALS